MKIIALTAENIKKLVAVEIRPDGNLVEISGENGQGKSSVLDAIAWALEGTKHIQSHPIRQGWTEARIRLDLGELVVTRKFKKTEAGETTSSLSVESADGAKFPSPQTLLDGLLGALAFDPLAFARMAPKLQLEELKRLVPGVDFAAIESQNALDFSRRTELNRKAKEARAAADSIKVSEDGPVVEVDEAALIAELEAAGHHNAAIEQRKANREASRREADAGHKVLGELTVKAVEEAQRIQADAKAEAERIIAAASERAKKVIEEAQQKAHDLTARVSELEEKLAKAGELPEPRDTQALAEKCEAARKTNAVVRERLRKLEFKKKAAGLELLSAELTKEMEERTAKKTAAIKEAKLPVEGLGFGEDTILMNGVPFAQASSAEQLKTSVAIAMSLNPKLRVIRVKDGSLLDAKSMELLSEMAREKDYQVWVERVGSGKMGFILEDGKVKTPVNA
jgi:DNA repair exonuclease SbcCD ATPase subunit